MTRLELLQSYSNTQLKDTWKILGGLEITDTTVAYIQDMVYRVNIPSSAFNGCLVLSNESISKTFDWENAIKSFTEDIFFQPNIISPYFYFIMDSVDLDPIINDPIDPNFIPFENYNNKIGDIYISQEDLDTILLEVGVPFILYEELEYNPSQIANLMIKPALQEYFKWFPKTVLKAYPITSSNGFKIQFPTWAYQVVFASVTQARLGAHTSSGIASPLLRYFDELMWSASNPMLGNSMARPNSKHLLNDWAPMFMEKAARQSVMNIGTRIHYEITEENGIKYFEGYANKQGTLQIGWAKYSNDVADVEYARKTEFRKLCSAKILKALGSLRAQGKNPSSANMYDYSNFLQRGDELEKDVIDTWKSITKYSGIIRGSH